MAKQINQVIPGGLLLKEVVERAELDRRTARYVLDKAPQLKIRPASGQGQHRRFTVAEAVRLAICTQLVMFGCPLDRAAWTTMFCEREFTRLGSKTTATNAIPYAAATTDAWLLRMVSRKYVQVWSRSLEKRNTRSFNFDPDVYCRIGDEDRVKLTQMPRHRPTIEWNLTDLAFVLATGPDDGLEHLVGDER